MSVRAQSALHQFDSTSTIELILRLVTLGDPMQSPARTGRSSVQLIYAELLLASLAYVLVQSLIAPVLPEIQRDLHTTQSLVTWAFTGYLLSASVLTPILGRLGDRIGKDRVMPIALAGLAAGLLLSAIAPNIGVLLVGRVIQGAGGGIVPLAFGIIRDEFPRERLARAVSMLAALLGAGSGAGIALAGPLSDALGYRALFWIPAIVVAVAAVASLFIIPPSPTRHPGRISVTAGVLLAAWLLALLLPLAQGSAWGWGSARVIGLFVIAAVLAVAWAVIESRSDSPLVDMRTMRLPAVWTTNVVSLLFGAGLYAVISFLPAFVETPASAGYGFGLGVTGAGLILLPMTLAMFFVGLVVHRLMHSFGDKAVLVAGTVIAVAGFVVLTAAHHDEWQVLVAMVVVGLGFGLAFAATSTVIVAAVPAHQVGVASGMNVNIRNIGGSLGAALMSSVIAAHTLPSGLPSESGYTYGFGAVGLASIAAVLAALLVPRRPQPGSAADGDPGTPDDAGITGAATAPSAEAAGQP
jgi:predicted MFS family arabinose efflux permease